MSQTRGEMLQVLVVFGLMGDRSGVIRNCDFVRIKWEYVQSNEFKVLSNGSIATCVSVSYSPW
jgi:hypothetical protein